MSEAYGMAHIVICKFSYRRLIRFQLGPFWEYIALHMVFVLLMIDHMSDDHQHFQQLVLV